MGFMLSPASVRNVMAHLEDLGYVHQPYTSAGRIPTETGYRLYVNALMERRELEREKRQWVDEHYGSRLEQLEEILELSSKLLSVLSHYTAVVQTPAMEVETVKRADVVLLSPRKVVVILVSSNGNIRKRVATLSRDMTNAELERLNSFLNEKLSTLTFAEASSVMESLEDSVPFEDEDLAHSAREIMGEILAEDKREIYLDGIENIFDQPEFTDPIRLRPVIRILDERRNLNELLACRMPEDTVRDVAIRIGSENGLDDAKGCSVVVSSYRIGGRTRGAVGVIGPTRMQYSRASSVVGFVAERLGHVLTAMCGE
jgi:heat-inducible transcriptional repressor